ncbi:interferon-induced protein 44-like isoform X2 [Cololabis saira]|uniref:interferon-induced protein 44-like isoform X2 n=1 Tax=Cololabis saira TaxID=129043 RepID=UPI002AD49538|nr:interferon-induced protein 44-like isoform X2 [Cololabis saira]
MAKSGRSTHFWNNEETELMLGHLKELGILRFIDGRKTRNGDLFKKVQEHMARAGYKRTAEQIRIRWKHLKQAYYRARRKEHHTDAPAAGPCPFSGVMEELLGSQPPISGVKSEDTSEEEASYTLPIFNPPGHMSTLNPQLSINQQRTICSRLGGVRLNLLYKASVHGFTAEDFHEQCDNLAPTVSVGYNASGYVFGGYTRQPFCQSGEYVNDNQAFLFTFSGEKLCTFPPSNAACAVKMDSNSGPYFGEALVLVSGSNPIAYSDPGGYYPFNPVKMHGNDLDLTECEVYQLEGTTEPEKPWRTVIWESDMRRELMESIQSYEPTVSSISQARVLLIGPVGAGKSSFFNSVNSVFRGHVTSQAISGSSTTSLTTQFRSYSVKAGRGGKPLPILLCDTMGLEESKGAGLDIDDISSVLKGHLPDYYQFNPSAPLHSEAQCYRKSPDHKDKIHCVVYVIDACKISIMTPQLQEKLDAIRRKVNLMGIPQLVLLTRIDEACPLVKEDLRNVYKSLYIKNLMQEVSSRLGMPMSCVVPVKNYSEELELDMNCDILLLSAITQMLRFVDNYFDELSDRLNCPTELC